MVNIAELLRTKDLTEEEAEWGHQVLQHQINQIGRLLDDLLDVGRITSGTLELRKAPVELANVIKSAVETSRPYIDAKGHRLVVDLEFYLRKQFAQRFEILLNFHQRIFVFEIGKRKLQLVLLFFFRFFQFFSRSLDREPFGIEQALDVQQKLNIPFLVQAMTRWSLGRLEQIEFCFPVAEHIRLNADDFTDLADFKINLVR